VNKNKLNHKEIKGLKPSQITFWLFPPT